MEVSSFAEIRSEFERRIASAVYCSVATVDRRGRPRSRIMHPVWDGSTGWVVSWPESHKAKHIGSHPFVSLAYVQDSRRPVYVDCHANWVHDQATQQHVWDLHGSTPPPVGFDLEPHYGSIDGPYFGVLRFIPWRIELAELGGEPVVWRPS